MNTIFKPRNTQFLVLWTIFNLNPLTCLSQCISGNCINGTGTKIYPDGSKYEGEWKDVFKHGQGTYTFSNGDTYVGEWKYNNKDGIGTLTQKDGTIKKGEWKVDKFLGMNNENTQIYSQSNPVQNKNEQSQYQTKNTSTGCISGNCTNGTGTMIYPDGSSYGGEWKDGKKHGKGTLMYKHYDSYNGEFKDDQRHGKGIYYWNDGRIYDGQWYNDFQNGFGSFTWKGGKYVGEWRDGVYIDRTPKSSQSYTNQNSSTGSNQNYTNSNSNQSSKNNQPQNKNDNDLNNIMGEMFKIVMWDLDPVQVKKRQIRKNRLPQYLTFRCQICGDNYNIHKDNEDNARNINGIYSCGSGDCMIKWENYNSQQRDKIRDNSIGKENRTKYW